jgi:hypothetical protein
MDRVFDEEIEKKLLKLKDRLGNMNIILLTF